MSLLLTYPDPPLIDEPVALRIWTAPTSPLVEEVSRDPHIRGHDCPQSLTRRRVSKGASLKAQRAAMAAECEEACGVR